MSLLDKQFNSENFIITTTDNLLNWGRLSSLWQMSFGLDCCAIEMMAFAMPKFDAARFGSEAMRMTPRQSDMLLVAGTVTYKMSWIVRKIYDQMPDPKWVMSMGVCASTGGMFRSYSVVQGIDQFLPVDVYVAGCPPRPEAVIKGLMSVQDKIRHQKPALINFGQDVNPTPTWQKERF